MSRLFQTAVAESERQGRVEVTRLRARRPSVRALSMVSETCWLGLEGSGGTAHTGRFGEDERTLVALSRRASPIFSRRAPTTHHRFIRNTQRQSSFGLLALVCL